MSDDLDVVGEVSPSDVWTNDVRVYASVDEITLRLSAQADRAASHGGRPRER